jgi:hypothetical protein
MIAVALSPIVMFVGACTWGMGKEWTVVASVKTGSMSTISVVKEPKPWPAVVAMVVTTMILGMAWIAIVQWRKTPSKPIKQDPDPL